MAYLELDYQKLKENYQFLNELFKKNNIKWSIVTKMLCGNKFYLEKLMELGVKQVCDSRLTNLKMIKQINPEVSTIYIKPPSKGTINSIIKYADISINTELSTIRWLSRAAKKLNTVHKIIIMIEMGELREGVLREKFMGFYQKVFDMSNIEIVGIGANFSCLYGVLPNKDKLIQLSLYKQIIETKFNVKIPYISGGSSVVIPLIFNNMLPSDINHFRVGETLFFGTDVYHNSNIIEMNHNLFTLYTEIIELSEKPTVPQGKMGSNVDGKTFDFSDHNIAERSFRAIIDLGLLDVDEKHLWPVDKDIEFVGASSDMIVIDLKENKNNYKVGDKLKFHMDYMGALRLMNSRYITKKVSD